MRRSDAKGADEYPQGLGEPDDTSGVHAAAVGSIDHANLGDLTGHLLRLAHLAAQREFAKAFPDGVVTSLQYGALELTMANPRIGHGQLADELQTSKTVLTTSLKALLASGMIAQVRDHSDSRLVCYRLTNEGEALLARLRRQVSVSEAGLAGKLGEGDVRVLKKLLRQLVQFPEC